MARYYRFVDGHFGQAIGKAKTSDLTIEFKDSMTGVKILTKGDIATFMSAIQDGDITITGDYKLLLWLASIAKHAAKLPEEYKGYLNQAKPYLDQAKTQLQNAKPYLDKVKPYAEKASDLASKLHNKHK